MKKGMVIAAVLLVAAGAFAQTAEEKKKAEADLMQFYVDQAKPVAEHDRLRELTGPWKITTKLWFDPSGEAETWSGTGSGKMILGGRFLQIDTDTRTGPFAVESLTILGFDRRTGEYTMTGIDTLGTYSITAAGKWDEARKGVVLNGSYLQPPQMTQQKYQFLWTKLSEKEHLLTLYFDMNGKDVRVAETRYAR
jgi:Protein of unknown function (DUF1579)